MRCLYKIFLCCTLLFASLPSLKAQQPDAYDDSDAAPQSMMKPAAEAPADTAIIYNAAAPSATDWERVISDKDIDYKNKREFNRTEDKQYEEPGWILFVLRVIAFFSSPAGKFILWSLLALIVGYVLYRILTGEGSNLFRRNRKMGAGSDEAAHPDDELEGHNWEERMRAALKGGDMRLAIRFSHMRLLQLLQERGLISYRQDKTNTEYYRELSGTDLGLCFRSLSREYETAWYGNFAPSGASFEAYMQTFETLKSKIRSR